MCENLLYVQHASNLWIRQGMRNSNFYDTKKDEMVLAKCDTLAQKKTDSDRNILFNIGTYFSV